MEKSTKLLWWGYEHENGSFQVKRYFNNRDLVEARESPFVVYVIGPFLAKDREEALFKMDGRPK